MGKILLIISLLILSLPGFSQRSGANESITFLSNTYNNYVIKPESYTDSTTKRYPLLLMFNGLGEVENNLSTINDYGPNRRILDGPWRGAQQLGDSTFEFISCAFQIPSSGIVAPTVLVRIVDTILTRYRVDTTRVYAVGLSGGAQGFFRSTGITTLSNYKYIQWTAAVLWSSGTTMPGAVIDSIAQWTRKGGGLMYAIGNADNAGNRIQAPVVLAAGNAGRPGSTVGYTWTHPPWPDAGHGGWNYGYDSSYTDPSLGINIYQFLLGHSKRPYAGAGEDVINTTETSVTLNGVSRQYPWGYNGNGTTTITWTKVSGPSATINSPNSDTTDVNLTGGEGTYIFRLTSANAAGGLSATKDVTVIKQSSSLPPGVVGVKEKSKKWFIKKAD